MLNFLRRRGAAVLYCLSFACFSLAPGASALAQERPADAVNRSAHIQMLVERITRSYAMLGQGVNPARSRRQLDTDIAAFDADLGALRGMPLSAAQKLALTRLGEQWSGFKAAATQAPSLPDARGLARGSAEMAKLAAAVTSSLRSVVLDRFDAIGLAGSARTLSQRMAKLYFYATWGLTAPEGNANFTVLGQEFRSAMDKLAVAPQNDSSTLADLALADSQWMFFSRALATLGTGEAKMQYMADVAKSSDAMLEVLDGLTLKYAASKEQDWAN